MVDKNLKINELNQKGINYYHNGHFGEAKKCLIEACHLAAKIYGKNHLYYAISLCNYGYILYETERDRKSIHYCESAKSIMEMTENTDSQEYRTILNNLAIIYSSFGYKSKACSIYEFIFEKETKNGIDSTNAITLVNLGSQYRDQGKYREALIYLERAKKLYKNEENIKSSDYIGCLNHLGLCHIGLKNYGESLLYFDQAIDLLKDEGMENGPLYLPTLNNIALAYQKNGDLEISIEIYNQILELFKVRYGENHPNIVNMYDNMSEIYLQHKNYKKTVELIIKSSRVNEKYIDDFCLILSETELESPIKKFRYHIDLLFSILREWNDPPQESVNQVFDVIFRRKTFFLDSAIYRKHIISLDNDERIKDDLSQLTSAKDEIAKMASTRPQDIRYSEEFNRRLYLLESECKKLERNIAIALPHSYFKKIKDINGYESVRANISSDSVVIDFVRYNSIDFQNNTVTIPKYAAFVIMNETDIQFVDIGSALDIDDLIMNTIHDIRDQWSPENNCIITQTLERLSDKILSPILSTTPLTQNLIVIPDGSLNLLPFCILVNNGKFLIDETRITYLTSARDLLKNDVPDTKKQTDSIIIADPDYDLADKEGNIYPNSAFNSQRLLSCSQELYEKLDETRAEGKKIHDIIGGDLWLDENALKSNLKTVHSPKILHITSHGFYYPQCEDHTNSLHSLFRCGFVLAGVNSFIRGLPIPTEAGNGIVTAYEVAGLDLNSTDMVVLSACETGLGDNTPSEGVFGFRRSFALAGAKTLVMSLWSIPDEETKELMVAFYSDLKAGIDRSEALHKAQLSIKKRHPQPYYWGAFILQGVSDKIIWN